jgi:hypothetical protein
LGCSERRKAPTSGMKRKPTLRGLKAKCWRLFSEYIRRKDADEGGTERCYTCGELAHWKELQAGHAIGGRHNAVLLDEEICRPQCVRCNVFLRGNYPVFTSRLIRERGLEWFEKKLEDSRRLVKWTRSDMEDLIALYKQKLEGLS